MTTKEKIQQLRSCIIEALTPLVNADYVLLDVPYYNNIGDVLIWEGTRDWLMGLPYKCLRVASKESFDFQNLPKNVIILLMGGGNFGDLYSSHQQFRLRVVNHYPDNRIIILPQTIFYKSWYTLKQDVRIFSQHKHLIICARDNYSYSLLKLFNVSKHLLLLPDMAFCVRNDILIINGLAQNVLFVKRKDNELALYNYDRILEKESCVRVNDWPTYEADLPEWIKLKHLMTNKDICIEQYADTFFRPTLVRNGIDFLSSYETIFTTRLHAFILAILLGKKVVVFDNIYGKNSDFINTWFKDDEHITLVVSFRVHFQRIKFVFKAIVKLFLCKP